MKKICDVFAATPLFAGMSHEVFHDYCAKTSIRIVWKGEMLVNEGDPCTGIGVVAEGQLAMQKYDRTGDYVTLELLGVGDLFGEHLIFGTRRTYQLSIEALTNAKVIFLNREMLDSLIHRHPVVMQNYLSILSDRVQEKNRRIHLLSQKSLRQKIANYLMELWHEQQKQEGNRPQPVGYTGLPRAVELPGSKEVVARLLAMPRPSFSRELISMERDGLIRVSGRVIWLTDPGRLERSVAEGFQAD